MDETVGRLLQLTGGDGAAEEQTGDVPDGGENERVRCLGWEGRRERKKEKQEDEDEGAIEKDGAEEGVN